MVTLFPYKSAVQSASCLTDMHLLKQCEVVESILHGKYNDTPIPGMWRGHLYELVSYGLVHCLIAHTERGKSIAGKWAPWKEIGAFNGLAPRAGNPPWLGDPWMHRSHRNRLVQLNYDHYSELWPEQAIAQPLIWPRIDDADSRGYRLFITPKHKHLVEKGVYRMPQELWYDNYLEVHES